MSTRVTFPQAGAPKPAVARPRDPPMSQASLALARARSAAAGPCWLDHALGHDLAEVNEPYARRIGQAELREPRDVARVQLEGREVAALDPAVDGVAVHIQP